MKNRKVWIALAALAVLLAAMAALWLTTRETGAEGAKSITVTVVHGDGSETVFEYRTDDPYLGETLLASGLVQGTVGPYGLEIRTVDGETADWELYHSYWALYIGTEYATTGADTTPLTDGGEYSLVYTLG